MDLTFLCIGRHNSKFINAAKVYPYETDIISQEDLSANLKTSFVVMKT